MILSPVPTLRRKKGTEKLAPVTCAHAAAEEGHREACSCHLCPRCGRRRVQEGVRRMTPKIKTVICAQAPIAVLTMPVLCYAFVTLNLLNQILAHNLLLYLRISLRFQIIPKIGNSLINILRDIFRRTQLFTNSFDQIPLRRDDLRICCIKLRHIVI